jgi:hypothetical protein
VSVVCCQIEVSASCWSLAKSSPTECGVSQCDREAPIMRKPWLTRGCCATRRNLYLHFIWHFRPYEKDLSCKRRMADTYIYIYIYNYDYRLAACVLRDSETFDTAYCLVFGMGFFCIVTNIASLSWYIVA